MILTGRVAIKRVSAAIGCLILMTAFNGTSIFAGDLRLQIYEGVTKDGGVQDRCLDTEIPVTIRKVDHQLYHVRVKSRWSGRVIANSIGEARNIGCRKKSKVILYGYEGNEPFK